VVIGARVTDKSQVPAGLVLKTIPAGKYAIFPTEGQQGKWSPQRGLITSCLTAGPWIRKTCRRNFTSE
jgi:hypothetical protein